MPEITAAIASAEPDIPTLQEMSSLPEPVAEVDRALGSLGLRHIRHSHDPCPETTGERGRKKHHCVIASRWPLWDEDPEADAWRTDAPYPEALCNAVVEAPSGPVVIFTAHIPNAATNGWEKIHTFRVLADVLQVFPNAPRILTGDFNEPKQFLSTGQIVTWGREKVLPDGGLVFSEDDKEFDAQLAWRSGVLAILAGQTDHGLRDAYRDKHGFEVLAPITHRLFGSRAPRCFDHTFVSSHFAVVESGYHHDWRRQGTSDHSAMWTELALSRELPPLDPWESPAGADADHTH